MRPGRDRSTPVPRAVGPGHRLDEGWSFAIPSVNQLSRGGTGDRLIHRAATVLDRAELALVPTALIATTEIR